jgi:hypothetical protein
MARQQQQQQAVLGCVQYCLLYIKLPVHAWDVNGFRGRGSELLSIIMS